MDFQTWTRLFRIEKVTEKDGSFVCWRFKTDKDIRRYIFDHPFQKWVDCAANEVRPTGERIGGFGRAFSKLDLVHIRRKAFQMFKEDSV